jgi:hypothetical protein
VASKKQQLQSLLGPTPIDAARFAELAVQLAPISTAYLRRLLRASEAPLTPEVEGVLQDSFDNLARTLTALSAAYETSPQPHAVRALVIEAKDHAKLALARDAHPADRQRKIAWMLQWLENPPVFPLWLALHRRRSTGTPPAAL